MKAVYLYCIFKPKMKDQSIACEIMVGGVSIVHGATCAWNPSIRINYYISYYCGGISVNHLHYHQDINCSKTKCPTYYRLMTFIAYGK